LFRSRMTGWLNADQLNLAIAAGDAIPPASLTAKLDFDARLLGHSEPLSADLNLQIDPASRWNEQKLEGGLQAQVVNVMPAEQRNQPLPADALMNYLRLPKFNLDLSVGEQTVKAEGALGEEQSRLNLD